MRAVSVRLHESVISFLCKTSKPGDNVSINGVPDDARLISCYYDPAYRTFYAIFEHDSFDEVPEGCPYTPARVEYTHRHAEGYEIF